MPWFTLKTIGGLNTRGHRQMSPHGRAPPAVTGFTAYAWASPSTSTSRIVQKSAARSGLMR
jgi:hypothetical protein